MKNEELIKKYHAERGLKKESYSNLKSILNHYSKFQNKTLIELLSEAEKEEEQIPRWKHRTLKKRLINYMNYLQETMLYGSAKLYFFRVKYFYQHYEITIGKLPAFNIKNGNFSEQIKYSDLPDKKIIQKAVEMSNPVMRCLILFLVSSGMSKVDALDLSVDSFIKGTYHYHKTFDIVKALSILENYDGDIIATFEGRRKKTNKYYVTFCSGEASDEIVKYLINRNSKKGLCDIDKLFDITSEWVTICFKRMNDELNLGFVGTYRRLRGHMLRKFNASNLKKHGMSTYDINILQGKSNGNVNESYFFEDEQSLKEKYVDAVAGVLIFKEVKNINRYSDEYLVLEKENKELREYLNSIEKDLQKIKEWYLME